jgi:DNA-directed RNA polymerase subunit RPC12/RpoP
MRYDYICNDCSDEEAWFVFETEHSMKKKPKVKCPQCGKTNTEVTFLTVPPAYTRGYGWLDKSGRRRDMHLWKLQNEDPYGGMREPGEKDDLANRLRRGGKFTGGDKKTFYLSKGNKKT